MTVQEKTHTAEEFIEQSQSAEYRDQRLELINGEICVMSPSSLLNTVVAAEIVRLLGNFNAEHKLGYMTTTDGGFKLGQHTVLVPDAAFISKDRVAKLGDTAFFEGAPDLAVEVISPSETNRQVLDKARAYLQAGTKMVWAVYPREQVIDVIRLAADNHLDIETLAAKDVLSGDAVLPGLQIQVKSIFPEYKD